MGGVVVAVVLAAVCVCVSACVAHIVVRTSAVLLTVQITGLLPSRTVRHL